MLKKRTTFDISFTHKSSTNGNIDILYCKCCELFFLALVTSHVLLARSSEIGAPTLSIVDAFLILPSRKHLYSTLSTFSIT